MNICRIDEMHKGKDFFRDMSVLISAYSKESYIIQFGFEKILYMVVLLKFQYCFDIELGISYYNMGKTTDLKQILEKDDTPEGLAQFKQILKDTSTLHADDINLLLRWAVTYQKKLFPQYYQFLSQLGADVNFVNLKDRKSNLMIACELKNEEIVETLANDNRTNFLLEDSTNKTALLYAINNKSKASGEKYVRILLKKCPQLLTNPKLSKRNNPLELAISLMKVQIVKALLDCGANPNQSIDGKGNTALHEAVRLMNHSKQKSYIQQIVQYLLEKGADPNITNDQDKSVFAIADKCLQQFEQMCWKAKNKERAIKPVFQINDSLQREAIFSTAQIIFNKYKHLIEKKNTEQNEQQEGYDDDPFEPAICFVDKLNEQVQKYAQQCLNDYLAAQKQLATFLNYLKPITQQLHLQIEVYGSYATGLWINQCDIDILLIPDPNYMIQNAVWYLQAITYKLRGSIYEKASPLKNLKIPLIRIQIGDQKDPRKTRKLDLSIYSPNNTGRQHTDYVNRVLVLYPKIKPLFYVIKKLTHCYKMYDPAKQGVRSLALFLMLAIFMQELPHDEPLGELLLRFLYKYGYNCQYQYEDNNNTMVLNLPDPVNIKNNIGKKTDAFALQKMFKASYIILHTKGIESRLEYLFQSKQLFF